LLQSSLGPTSTILLHELQLSVKVSFASTRGLEHFEQKGLVDLFRWAQAEQSHFDEITSTVCGDLGVVQRAQTEPIFQVRQSKQLH
jgi:hypothetical protein